MTSIEGIQRKVHQAVFDYNASAPAEKRLERVVFSAAMPMGVLTRDLASTF